MNTETLHVFELHNAGETRLIAGSLDPLPPLDIPQPTEPFRAGALFDKPAPKRAAPAPRRFSLLRALFGV